jgi:UDP-hydrolysing UDP-N-acetyl-D-glucosamine 2-epimerase
MSKRRKICVVTGSRADYGHLSSVIKEIAADKSLELQLVATGMHLSKDFGTTYKAIVADGIKIRAKVDILKFGYSEEGIAQSIGLGCQKFAKTFESLVPDIVVVLGDRFEILSAVIAAYVSKIPIAHIHGGEKSEGAMDEGFRHSITKMANVHFAATKEYKNRILQLGEDPKHVFNFGAPGLDALTQIKLLTKSELEKDLSFSLESATAIVTFHPVTLENKRSDESIINLLNAIKRSTLKAIFTKSNADPHGTSINKVIAEFCRKDPLKYKFVDSLGQKRYYSCLKSCDLMIGNSSSGLVEAPSFKLPVINVGDRQRGRTKAKNVIDTDDSSLGIQKAITLALSKSFKKTLSHLKNPYQKYSDGQTGRRIKDVLKNLKITDELMKKRFFDAKS